MKRRWSVTNRQVLKQITLLTFLLTVSSLHGLARAASLEEVRQYIKSELDATGVPGAALIVIEDGDVALLEAYGVADAAGRPVSSDTPFVIGSLTKSFTALAAMQLVERGMLDMDTPVKDYLPYFWLDDARADNITLRHALNHTTGITWWDGLGYESSQDLSADAIQERVEALKPVSLTSSPGEQFAYSNVNYVIVGAVIEAVTGRSYEEYITQNIFEPLQMNDSYASIGEARKNGLATGHRYIFGEAVAAPNLPYGRSDLPSYLLSSSIADMGKYLAAHMNGGVYQGRRVLSESGMKTLHLGATPTPYDDLYALGWFDERWEGERVLNHYGSFTGYHANMMIAPERGLGMVMLTNAESYLANERRWEIAKNAFRLSLAQEVQTGTFSASLAAFWIVSLCSLALLADLLWFLLRRARGIEHFSLARSLLISAVFVGLGTGFLCGFPRIFDAPMSSIRLSTPDVGYVLTIMGILTLLWGLARTPLGIALRSARKE